MLLTKTTKLKAVFGNSKIYRDQYVALSGVSEGEKVIVTGYQKVKPGAKVGPSEWQPSSRGSR